jgi:hypothetical protein
MKMVEGTRLDLLLDVVIATGYHVDVLLVLRLLLVQNISNEKLHGTTEVCLTWAILLNWYILWIGWFREVLMNGLLPGSFVLALEHILDLHKGVSIVKVDLLGPFFKLRDRFVYSKLDTQFLTVLVDFGLDSVSRVATLQFVGLG